MDILNDFNTSVEKAFDEIDPKWREYKGLVICGTHKPKDPEIEIELITLAKYQGIPFLGICFGHQLAAIEYARNVVGIKNATSEEFMISPHQCCVVKKRPEGLKVGLHDGESYWNNYEVDYTLVPNFEKDKPKHFITTQAHPEYQSTKDDPHSLLVKFLDICKQK